MGIFKNLGGRNVNVEKIRPGIIIPHKGDDVRNQEILRNLEEVSDAQISEIGKVLQTREKEMGKRELVNVGSLGNWRDSFRSNIKGVSDAHADMMINLLKKLIKENRLKITTDKTGRYIDFDILDYKIHVLNIGNYSNIIKSVKRKTDSYEVNETNKDGMVKMSKYYDTGWSVATETDLKNMFEKLAENYLYMKPGRNGDNHDEDIAFFMLMTQCVGEFLLNNDRVLKCYYDFRGFRNMRDGATGQLILVKRKQ